MRTQQRLWLHGGSRQRMMRPRLKQRQQPWWVRAVDGKSWAQGSLLLGSGRKQETDGCDAYKAPCYVQVFLLMLCL